ncbi:hypothetical protein DSECCO2_457200 [anaerobic digester metagenome]
MVLGAVKKVLFLPALRFPRGQLLDDGEIDGAAGREFSLPDRTVDEPSSDVVTDDERRVPVRRPDGTRGDVRVHRRKVVADPASGADGLL